MSALELLEQAVSGERKRRSAETSLYEFSKQAWHVVEPGTDFVPSWHIEVICEHLEAITAGQITRLLINIPPRHSKSTIIVMWTAWEWIRKPSERYLCASYANVLSIRDNLKARRLIASTWYQDRWGSKFALTGDQNQKSRFENDKMGYRIATSVGGTATGEGGSRLVLDDPHGAQDAQSDALRKSTLEWFDMVWSTRLNDPKRDAMVTIMQRLHEDDVSGHILRDLKNWEHICIPAEWDGKIRSTVRGTYDPRTTVNELICSERFGREQIDALKILLGEYGTGGQLQQNPVPSVGGLLKVDCFRKWPSNTRLPQFEYVLQSYDGAYTESTLGDPTACTVWGIFTHNKTHHTMLLDAWAEHLPYPKLREKVLKDWSAEYGGGGVGPGQPTRAVRASRVLIENKSSGLSLLQDLRQARVPVAAYNPGNMDKVARAHQTAPTLEAGLVWIPESTKDLGEHVVWARPFVAQVKKFPVDVHDDYVDTFTQAVIYLKNEGWLKLPRVIDVDVDVEPVVAQTRTNPYGS